jgi:hypothetical protein
VFTSAAARRSVGHGHRRKRSAKDVLRRRAIGIALSVPAHGSAADHNDESVFRTLRDACVSSAIDLYGDGSREHRTTVLAFYAVGLQTPETTYGADVTFLRWGWDWRLSRPHLGGIHSASPNWSSLDLYVNNGGGSEWNALINEETPTGPTQFENKVYCRVRNVGDLPAEGVQVQFDYAKAGTGSAAWIPVTDKDGIAQVLNIGTLGAGASNFPESQQETPPAAAGVKWYIPPLGPAVAITSVYGPPSARPATSTCTTTRRRTSPTPYSPSLPFKWSCRATRRREIPLNWNWRRCPGLARPDADRDR